MTTCRKISPSLKEIIDAFIKNKFNPLTLTELGEILDEDPNTINQRILRDENNLFSTPNPNSKPKKIQLNQTHPDVVCYYRNNQCYGCKRTFKPEKLTMTYLDSQNKRINSLHNLIVKCEECIQSPINKVNQQSKRKATAKSTSKKNQNNVVKWEYKSILIRYNPGDEGSRMQYGIGSGMGLKLGMDSGLGIGWSKEEDVIPAHYEYREEGEEESEEELNENSDEETDENLNDEIDDEPKWYYIENKGEIASFAISDILNYFGKQGWDFAYMEHLSPRHVIHEEDYGGDNSENDEVPEYALFLCVLKRMRGNAT